MGVQVPPCIYFSNTFNQPCFIGGEEGVLGIIPRFFPYPHRDTLVLLLHKAYIGCSFLGIDGHWDRVLWSKGPKKEGTTVT